jgi:hypothetical protein
MKNLPDWIRIASITTDNRTSFELSNGSTIKAASTSGDAGRSEALSLLVLDEAATLMGLKIYGPVCIPHYQPVVGVLLFQHQMVLVIGFTKRALAPKQMKIISN